MTDLTDTERAMLDFTKTTWRYKGQQDEAIRKRFGMSPTRFWQQIGGLVERPEALVYDSVTVNRLRRLRQARRGARGVVV